MADLAIGSGFEHIYGVIKNTVMHEMLTKKGGEVVIPTKNIPTFISEAWLDLSVERLLEELKDEYGVAAVYVRRPILSENIEKAIVIEG